MRTESKESLVSKSSSSNDEEIAAAPPTGTTIKNKTRLNKLENEFDYVPENILTNTEKRFLLSAERGDCATVKQLIKDYKDQPEELNLNCVDPLERSALISAIENENIELIRLLLDENIEVKDALLHAISEEYVEAVETLLVWEEENHKAGTPYSWESVDRSSSSFTQDITPLILAAHMNNYEILKLLLDRGASLPMPHDVRCGCDECVTSSSTDSLRHSQSRINAYKALSSSSLIALSSRDPILTAFELSWELRRLSRMETEFRAEYNEMRKSTQEFATALLGHARTSNELEIMLNYNPNGENWEPGERQTLERLKLAIKYKQKQFVAHPNVQQLLAKIWYDGLPGFRRKAMVGQAMQVAQLASMFPFYCTVYMMAPNSEIGKFMKKPFMKFITHSASYAFFLTLLGAASQRVEFLLLEWFGTDWMQELLLHWKKHERGSLPGLAEGACMIYVVGLIWGEIRSLYADGLIEYVSDLWNIVDFISNSFYVAWISLRFTSWYTVMRDANSGKNPDDIWYPREEWSPFDPMLLSEGAFAAGMIFSFLKLVHIFSINPHLGPLQVSLGRMIIDIIKFFFIYTLVLFAFGCGLNQLLWYYADLEKHKCYHLHPDIPDFDNAEKACSVWRRFANLFETSQSLFWASFGLVDLMAFDLEGIKSFTRFWALLMFGSYSVINIIVLLNMLIAMMSNSYQIISERSDVEWKFARSDLWISYFDDGSTLPPPFNLFPTVKMLKFGKAAERSKSTIRRSRDKAKNRHDNVMKLLVRRYVCDEQRKRDDFGVTEDDVMEIRQDISSLKYELIDIFKTNGMKTPNVNKDDSSVAGKKGKMMERRILKDFQIGIVEGIISESLQAVKEPKDVFSTIANVIKKRASSKMKKEDWNAMVRKGTVKADPIGNRAEASKKLASRQSLRRAVMEVNQAGLQSDSAQLVEVNPALADVGHSTRIAYAKFMNSKFKKEIRFNEVEVMDEATRARELKAFNRFKEKTGILKKRASDGETTAIKEDPREGAKTPDSAKSPSPKPSTSSTPQPTATPEPSKPAAASPAPKSAAESASKSSTPDSAKSATADPPKASSSSPADKPAAKPETAKSPPTINEPAKSEPAAAKKTPPKPAASKPEPAPAAAAPVANLTSDKGKSKISGKTLTGWI